MEKQQILEEVQEIFRDVLDNKEIVLTPETTSNDVLEWDSLSHIQLIVEIESHFDIDFKAEEIISWKNVGDMVHFIYQHKQ